MVAIDRPAAAVRRLLELAREEAPLATAAILELHRLATDRVLDARAVSPRRGGPPRRAAPAPA